MCTFFLHDTLTIDIARLSLHDALPISLMFQSYPVHDGYEDPQLSNFYGQALPLFKRGVPVSTVHIENLSYSGTLEDVKVLIDRKSTRLNSSHVRNSYAVLCLKKHKPIT